MSKSTEKGNIAKLNELIDEIEATREKGKSLLIEVKSLLRKRYPSSGTDEQYAKSCLIFNLGNFNGNISKARAALQEERLIVVRP